MAAKGDRVTLYTAQRQIVADILQKGDIYYAQKRYIREKYGDAAGVFLAGYEWYAACASAIVPRPPQAESAVWAFTSRKDANPFGGGRVLVLEVPKTQAVFFDMLEWGCVLSGEPLGSETERLHYTNQLAAQGVADGYAVVSTPFYPLLKRELHASWNSLFRFDGAIKAGQAVPVSHIQAGLWYLRPEWVVDSL